MPEEAPLSPPGAAPPFRCIQSTAGSHRRLGGRSGRRAMEAARQPLCSTRLPTSLGLSERGDHAAAFGRLPEPGGESGGCASSSIRLFLAVLPSRQMGGGGGGFFPLHPPVPSFCPGVPRSSWLERIASFSPSPKTASPSPLATLVFGSGMRPLESSLCQGCPRFPLPLRQTLRWGFCCRKNKTPCLFSPLRRCCRDSGAVAPALRSRFCSFKRPLHPFFPFQGAPS